MTATATTAWAEWGGHFVRDGKRLYSQTGITADSYVQGKHLTVYPTGWDHPDRVEHFSSKWNKHGHNWWMTTRLDFWFTPTWDPYEWHGHLITGGMASTFRVRRCIRRSIFHRIDGKLPPIREVTRETIGTLPVWRASFHKHPDVWAACPGNGRWGVLDWTLAPDPDELIRYVALKRLKLVA